MVTWSVRRRLGQLGVSVGVIGVRQRRLAPQLTLNRPQLTPNQHQIIGVNVTTPYFEGAESIPALGLVQL